MVDSELTQASVERCERNDTPVEELASHFRTALERLGFCYFACCSHVDPLNPPGTTVVLHNYPSAWERTFCELKLHELDPVMLQAERSLLPFHWNDAGFRAHLSKPKRQILAEGAMLGLVHEYTIPIHIPREWGAVRASFVSDAGTISPGSYYAAQLMASYLYRAGSRQLDRQCDAGERIALTVRERQSLELVAQGKTDWVIGRYLGLERMHGAHVHRERQAATGHCHESASDCRGADG